MAEGTYEYECMRAELLGDSAPDKEEFLAKQREQLERQAEEIEGKTLEEVETQNDDIKNVSGGLDELNSILSSTQKKLNRFKSACGSLTNLLKIKVGHSESTESIPTKESSDTDEKNDDQNVTEPSCSSLEDQQSVQPKIPVQNSAARKNDLSKAAEALDNSVNKLDLLLNRADTAHINMEAQRKQMRKFLK